LHRNLNALFKLRKQVGAPAVPAEESDDAASEPAETALASAGAFWDAGIQPPRPSRHASPASEPARNEPKPAPIPAQQADSAASCVPTPASFPAACEAAA